MQLYALATILAAIGGVNAQGRLPWLLRRRPPVAPPPAPPVAPAAPPPAIAASVVAAASAQCAAIGQPTPYFDSNGNPAFCGPRIWSGGNIPAGTNLCP
ncbi:hypothetical protein PG990_005143 [Apiospora arundinis]